MCIDIKPSAFTNAIGSVLDRIYVNERARRELGWQPKYNFEFVLDLLDAGEEPRSPLARAIGSKGYHAGLFADGTYPIE